LVVFITLNSYLYTCVWFYLLTWPWVTVQETESLCRRRLYKPVVLPINGKHKKENRMTRSTLHSCGLSEIPAIHSVYLCRHARLHPGAALRMFSMSLWGDRLLSLLCDKLFKGRQIDNDKVIEIYHLRHGLFCGKTNCSLSYKLKIQLQFIDWIPSISFGYILYCVCFNLYCVCCNVVSNVWVCVCVRFVMCGCLYVWVFW